MKDERLIPYAGGNLGTPLELVEGLVVPAELLFVRNNGEVPALDPDAWRLALDGYVEQPLSLSLSDLQAMPRRSVTAFLECAGNSRTRFEPVPEGTPWANDAVGNAVWTGTSLAHVLERAGVKAGAVDVVSQGADFARMQRGLPLGVALDPDTLLVWELNGRPLPVAHGGPVRLLVPRWAGIASTKWLTSLTVLTHPFDGYYNHDNYVLYTPEGEALQPVREMPVKSLIARPAHRAHVVSGPRLISGFAWSGFGGVTAVDVSTDGGDTWEPARIVESAGRLSWVRFELEWDARPGRWTLASRARDERGLVQPRRAPWNLKGYQNNGIQTVTVTVE